MTPKRIQLRRTKGWRKPEGAVVCSRPSRWGNPFTSAGCREVGYVGTDREIAQRVVEAFRAWLVSPLWRHNWDSEESERCRQAILDGRESLRGKDLCCWCRLCEKHKDGRPLGEACADCKPCHVDVLLELANK